MYQNRFRSSNPVEELATLSQTPQIIRQDRGSVPISRPFDAFGVSRGGPVSAAGLWPQRVLGRLCLSPLYMKALKK